MLESLERTHALVSNPKTWTRYALARDQYGMPTDPNGGNAQSFCFLGALWHCTNNYSEYLECLNYLHKCRTFKLPLWELNDSEMFGRECCAWLLEKAIASLKEETKPLVYECVLEAA